MILNHLKIYKYVYLWAIIVLGLCGTNGKSIPEFSLTNFTGFDKIAHIILFGTGAFLIAIASKKANPNATNFNIIFPAFIIGTMFGIVIEILQATIFINRSFEFLDMVADTLGCLLAWLILLLVFKFQLPKTFSL